MISFCLETSGSEKSLLPTKNRRIFFMKKNMLSAIACVTVLTLGMGSMAGCGSNNEKTTANETASEAETQTGTEAAETEAAQAGTSASVSYPLMYDDTDESLLQYAPVLPVSGSYAELMMQVSGYTYTFDTLDDTTYELICIYECGTPGADTTMYMKRTLTYTGSYTADGGTYTLDFPEHFNMVQETAGQFAASSGEGGADFWGPNGLEIDETYAGGEYDALSSGADWLALMDSCTVTVNGSEITGFEQIASNASADESATEAATGTEAAAGTEAAGTEAAADTAAAAQ